MKNCTCILKDLMGFNYKRLQKIKEKIKRLWSLLEDEDFEGVSLLPGGSGEIDKKKNLEITHLSDAFGYYIAQEYPTRPHYEQSQKISGF